jgi:hypothetical protein
MKLVKTDQEDFMKDLHSKAILNTNVEACNAYKKQRDRLLRTDSLITEVETLKTDVSEIKSMLVQLLNRTTI